QFRDGVVHRGADRSRRAVHVFERRRNALEERDRSLGSEHGLLLPDLLDLGDRLLDARDRRPRLPAESVPTKARLELPLVRLGCGLFALRLHGAPNASSSSSRRAGKRLYFAWSAAAQRVVSPVGSLAKHVSTSSAA